MVLLSCSSGTNAGESDASAPVTSATSEATSSSSEPVETASQSQEDATGDRVPDAIAALPLDQRVGRLAEAETAEGLWVLSRPPGQGPETALGDYGELLLLDSSASKILRAYPLPLVPPQSLVVTDEAVYCARQGDGGLPDSMICRVDRSTLDATVRVFPWQLDSAFHGRPADEFPPNWMIGDPIDIVVFERIGSDGEGITVEGQDGSRMVDPLTLELTE